MSYIVILFFHYIITAESIEVTTPSRKFSLSNAVIIVLFSTETTKAVSSESIKVSFEPFSDGQQTFSALADESDFSEF